MPIEINRATFLSVLETSQKLRVTPQTVRNYLKKGELESIRVGRALLIPEKKFTLSRRNRKAGLFKNMEQNEREQLLLEKERLEKRIAEHQDIIDRNLKDREAKLPNFRERLEKVRAIVEDAKKNLAEVNRRLELTQ